MGDRISAGRAVWPWGWLTPPAPELLLSLPAKATGSALGFSDPTCSGKGFVCFFHLIQRKKKKKERVCCHVGSINVIFKLFELCLETAQTELVSKWGGTALPRAFLVPSHGLK